MRPLPSIKSREYPNQYLFFLEKHIPVAAGLGGGSSNAAATLKGLSRLFNVTVRPKRLHQIALELGSDVPFFLEHIVALGKGVGEDLSAIASQLDFPLLLINPKFPVRTQEIYQSLCWPLTAPEGDIKMAELALRQGDLDLLCQNLFNRLESVVLERFPKTYELKKMLMKLGSRGVMLSGSGPTLFVILENKQQAIPIQIALEETYRGQLWTKQCYTLRSGDINADHTS